MTLNPSKAWDNAGTSGRMAAVTVIAGILVLLVGQISVPVSIAIGTMGLVTIYLLWRWR